MPPNLGLGAKSPHLGTAMVVAGLHPRSHQNRPLDQIRIGLLTSSHLSLRRSRHPVRPGQRRPRHLGGHEHLGGTWPLPLQRPKPLGRHSSSQPWREKLRKQCAPPVKDVGKRFAQLLPKAGEAAGEEADDGGGGGWRGGGQRGESLV